MKVKAVHGGRGGVVFGWGFSPLRMRMLVKKAYETFLGDHGARSKSSFSTVTGRASGLKVLVLFLFGFVFGWS